MKMHMRGMRIQTHVQEGIIIANPNPSDQFGLKDRKTCPRILVKLKIGIRSKRDRSWISRKYSVIRIRWTCLDLGLTRLLLLDPLWLSLSLSGLRLSWDHTKISSWSNSSPVRSLRLHRSSRRWGNDLNLLRFGLLTLIASIDRV